jgi:hypothetical protein
MPDGLSYEEAEEWARAKGAPLRADEQAWQRTFRELERECELRLRERLIAAGFEASELSNRGVPTAVSPDDRRQPSLGAAMRAYHRDRRAMLVVLGVDKCVECGAELELEDVEFQRGTCKTCRDRTGKLGDLAIAIRATGDSPGRIKQWPEISHWAREKWGDLKDEVLFERILGMVDAHTGDPSRRLLVPISDVLAMLREAVQGSTPDAPRPANGIHEQAVMQAPPAESDDNAAQPATNRNHSKHRWHAATEQPPADFSHGPLTGTHVDLAAAIVPNRDKRTLESKAKSGVVWVRKDAHRSLSVWFHRDCEGQYKQADDHLRRIRAKRTK